MFLLDFPGNQKIDSVFFVMARRKGRKNDRDREGAGTGTLFATVCFLFFVTGVIMLAIGKAKSHDCKMAVIDEANFYDYEGTNPPFGVW